jgi:hypothetical protein
MAAQQELPGLRLRGTRFCLVCGFRSVRENGRCTFCREVRTWSEVNRAFCALVHGDRTRTPAALDGS